MVTCFVQISFLIFRTCQRNHIVNSLKLKCHWKVKTFWVQLWIQWCTEKVRGGREGMMKVFAIKFSQIKLNFVPQVPQQENGYDCGVFVMLFLEAFLHRKAGLLLLYLRSLFLVTFQKCCHGWCHQIWTISYCAYNFESNNWNINNVIVTLLVPCERPAATPNSPLVWSRCSIANDRKDDRTHSRIKQRNMIIYVQTEQLRNRKHVPCFYRVMETRVKVWENEKYCVNTSRRRPFPQLFQVIPNFHNCFFNSIGTKTS